MHQSRVDSSWTPFYKLLNSQLSILTLESEDSPTRSLKTHLQICFCASLTAFKSALSHPTTHFDRLDKFVPLADPPPLTQIRLVRMMHVLECLPGIRNKLVSNLSSCSTFACPIRTLSMTDLRNVADVVPGSNRRCMKPIMNPTIFRIRVRLPPKEK